jgi:CRISPR system Cascade subunit CasD
MVNANTLFLRLEGPLQAWGDHRSKFVIRRTGDVPTKSGVFGTLCAALGVPRRDAQVEWLPRLKQLAMAVRVDRPGIRWWDYHTAGAGYGLLTAEGKIKVTQKTGEVETLVSRREYLCDASFLVALQGEPGLIAELAEALGNPQWTYYLGRRSCPPSRSVMDRELSPPGNYPDLLSALKAVPWRKRVKNDAPPAAVTCFLEWVPGADGDEAPDDALVFYDIATTFLPPAYEPRFVIRRDLTVGKGHDVEVASGSLQKTTPAPPRPRANYSDSRWLEARARRLEADDGLCVFCKSPATTVHHVTYRPTENLRSLCRLCHDAVTMLEYGAGMGIDRINPEDPYWRERIIRKRAEIIAFRSLATRRRRFAAREVE